MKNNLEYWKARAKARVESYTADADTITAELGKAYYAAERMLKEESRKVFKGFQNAFKLSESEAERLISSTDVALPSKAVSNIINNLSDPELKNQLRAYVSAPAYQYRMKRLDNLAKSADKVCKQLYAAELRTDTAYFATEIDKAYKHLIFDVQQGTGTCGAFNQIPQSRIQEILKQDWSGRHYSERIWGNTQNLAETLKQNMIESFLTGESEQRAAARIQQRFSVGFNEARRLIRTENTFVTNQAELEGYNEAEIEEYSYMAVMDSDTSEQCRELNGKSFKVKNAEPGVNLPPMHPWCRSTTIAKLPGEEELDATWDKDMAETVPEGLSFDEWLDGLQPTYDGKLCYMGVDKSAKSDIMKMRGDSVALENQRYGRNKSTLVNKTYINSGEYKRKFDNATENPDVNKSLYDCAKQALKHRSGTVYEDMYWIGIENGEIVLAVTDSVDEHAIAYTDTIRKAIKGNRNLVTLHTHPSSMPPSIDDFNSSYRNGYQVGFVACHDGKVFRYSSKQEISKELYNLYVNEYIDSGLSEYDAQLQTIVKLSENHAISFEEVS